MMLAMACKQDLWDGIKRAIYGEVEGEEEEEEVVEQ